MTILTTLMQPWIERWYELSQRDQRALIITILSLTLFLLWSLVIQPLHQWQSEVELEQQNAKATFQALMTKAPEAMSYSTQTVDNNLSLNGELRRQANRFGLTIQSFEPDGDLLRVRMDDVRYSRVVTWLGELENSGIVTEQLILEARPTAGLVSLRASFGQ